MTEKILSTPQRLVSLDDVLAIINEPGDLMWPTAQEWLTDKLNALGTQSESAESDGPDILTGFPRKVIRSGDMRIRYVVRAGGECPQDWLCRDIPEVQQAICEALYGDPSNADPDSIGWYVEAIQKMAPEELKREWRFEDGWLEVLKLRQPAEDTPSATEFDKLAAAVKAYDEAIHSCGNDPEKMASFCSAQGDDLDVLYFNMVNLANRAGQRIAPEGRANLACAWLNASKRCLRMNCKNAGPCDGYAHDFAQSPQREPIK